MQRHYYVYILTNDTGTVLYVGITRDLSTRVEQHESGWGGGFTSKYRASRLVYFETHENVLNAIAREKQIKSWRRSKKEDLIRKVNPRLVDLGPTFIPPQR